MKLSTKARYGLQIMYYLAQHHTEDFQSVANISCEIGVSEKYLEKLLSGLKSANLIVSSRGVIGGYKLINSPSVITCGQILRAVEDELVFADCVHGNCDKKCANKKVFMKLIERVNDNE